MNKGQNCILFLLLFVCVVFLYGCSSDSTTYDTQIQNETDAPTATKEFEEFMESIHGDSSCLIAPGDSRTFTLTGSVPFFHSTDIYSSLDIEYDLAFNSWAKYGLDVVIEHVQVYLETGDIWTVQQMARSADGTTTTYYMPLKIMDGGTIGTSKGRGVILVQTNRPREYLKWGNLSLSEVYEKFKIDKKTDPNLLATRPFSFYQFFLTFTIYAPEEDQLEVIDNNVRFKGGRKLTNLVFWPRRVIFHNWSETEEMELSKDRHLISLEVSLSGKPTSGYRGIRVINHNSGYDHYDLTCN